MLKKKCSKCGIAKKLEEFYRAGTNWRADCKSCCNSRKNTWANKNRIKVRSQSKKSRNKHKNKRNAESREWYNKNRNMCVENRRNYVKNYPDRIKKSAQKYKPRRNKVNRDRYKKDIAFRLLKISRALVYDSVKGFNKSTRTRELIGCSPEEYKKHLESTWTINMSWENHGTLWEIDHIRPLNTFDMSKPKQQKQAFNFTNTRAILKEENRKRPKDGSDLFPNGFV